jgi:hypothetical protein
MIDPLPAKWSARSSLSAGRFKRLLGLDSSPRTVETILPRYAAETPFSDVWDGLTFGSTGRPAKWQGR